MIIGIIGSMRHRAYMDEVERKLIRDGKTPISPTRCFELYTGNWSDADKKALNELHLRKLALCDSIFVVNVDGYVGESTQKEIEHATQLGKQVVYLC